MGALFEPLLLYIILFLSNSAGQISRETISVTPGGELYRIFMYNIPSLALIWYLLYRNHGFKPGMLKPRKSDLVSAVFALPGLALTGFAIALISPYFSGIPQGPAVSGASGISAWLILTLSCISTGYLEESFFRYYLLSKREEMGLSPVKAALVSTLLFSICHIYEGPWGFLNAVLSGFLLSFIFLRYRSLHGIALSHGLYNILVYVVMAQHL